MGSLVDDVLSALVSRLDVRDKVPTLAPARRARQKPGSSYAVGRRRRGSEAGASCQAFGHCKA